MEEEVLKRMVTRKALGKICPITTDNGCEFLDPEKTKSVVRCDVCYTRAYAKTAQRRQRK